MDGKVLLVTRANLARVVSEIAPDMVLVPRQRFIKIAEEMLRVVEAVNTETVP